MGTCGCRYCPPKVESPVKHIATMTTVAGCNGTTGSSDPIETHTRKCVIDSAKNKVMLAFDEYLKIECGAWGLIEELKEKIISAK